jgi:hypothetical protein
MMADILEEMKANQNQMKADIKASQEKMEAMKRTAQS